MAIEGMARGDVSIVLHREDSPASTLSPNLRAEYHLKASLEGTRIRLAGRRIVTDPGTKESMSWLKNNNAEVTGNATLRR